MARRKATDPGGGVPITIGGAARNLRYDLNALIELEETTGLDVLNDDAMADLSLKMMRALLWAGFLHEAPDLTEREVGSWITLQNMDTLTDALTRSYSAALPEADKNNPPTPPEKN